VDVLVVVDMQEGLLAGDSKRDLPAVIERINRLADRIRSGGGRVVFVRHEGSAGDGFAPGAPGWEILGDVRRASTDHVVGKTLNDAFHRQ